MDLTLLRIGSLIAIGLVYMLFDLFNNRNVPEIFAYATLAYGAVLTLLYFNTTSILLSAAVAVVVLGLGYIVYKIGQIGAADIIELAAISLILPLQALPVLNSAASQFGLPFVLSVVISSGIAALIIIPIYYLPRAKRMLKKPLLSYVDNRGLFKATLITVAYAAFIAFLGLELGTGIGGLTILALLLVGSSAIMLFEKPITDSMVERVSVSRFEEGDIIAFNLMNKGEITKMKSRINGFDRLVTRKVIDDMKAKRVKESFPVYRKAMPLALPIFVGIIVSLLFGNVILYLVPALA